LLEHDKRARGGAGIAGRGARVTAMGLFSPVHLVVLGVLALFLFGPNRLPEMGRQLGRGMRDFREAIDGTGIKDALDGVNEVRAMASPTNMARAFVPGVADSQDAMAAAKNAVNPLAANNGPVSQLPVSDSPASPAAVSDSEATPPAVNDSEATQSEVAAADDATEPAKPVPTPLP
jgi:TatA/E family protein of Tat protein translocase